MWTLRLHRLVYTRRTAGTALQRCWQTPLPATGTDWRQVSFLVVDAEMSSLDVKEGELLSVGWVAVESGGISSGQCPALPRQGAKFGRAERHHSQPARL